MAQKMWVYDPQSGGRAIPDAAKPSIRRRILEHAKKNYSGKYNRIDVRFRSKCCYIDAYTEPFVPPENYDATLYGKSREDRIAQLRAIPIHLCRLRYFGDEDRGYVSHWTRDNGVFTLDVTIPEGCVADIVLPDGSTSICKAGKHTLRI